MPAKKRSTSAKKKKTSTKKTKDASPSELRALFDLMDTDGSGAIDQAELMVSVQCAFLSYRTTFKLLYLRHVIYG